jgi:hypothetical protein
MTRLPRLQRLALLVCVVTPALAWALVKPLRVVAPELNGVRCVDQLCADDLSRLEEAQSLDREANAFLAARFGLVLQRPRIVFCATQSCADGFGLGARSAVTVGTTGTVIGPTAWKPYYVRHELIHQLQAQQLGVIALLFKPAWLVEGMAYGLSDDPRPTLAEPWQAYRTEFLDWYRNVGAERLWTAARAAWWLGGPAAGR